MLTETTVQQQAFYRCILLSTLGSLNHNLSDLHFNLCNNSNGKNKPKATKGLCLQPVIVKTPAYLQDY